MPVATTKGGETRRDSVVAAWRASGASDDDLLCVHDAARPLVEPADVAAVVAAAAEHGAALAGSPVTDTIKRVRDGIVVETVPRHDLFAAATPQVMRAGLLPGGGRIGPRRSDRRRRAPRATRGGRSDGRDLPVEREDHLSPRTSRGPRRGSRRCGREPPDRPGARRPPARPGPPLRPRRGGDPVRRRPGRSLGRRRRSPRPRRRPPRDRGGGGPRQRFRDDRPGVAGRPVLPFRHRGAREGRAARRS